MKELPSPLPPDVLRRYTGGHTVVDGGYVFELCPGHAKANRFGFVPQHRLVMERSLGCYLPASAQVHHRDENPLNNALENLQVMTRREHLAHHRRQDRERRHGPLERETVRQQLQAGGLKAAARALGCHPETIRNNYPDLVDPYKRRSPSRIDDPAVIAKVLAVAADDKAGYREVARQTGISYRTVQRICERNGIQWTRKTKLGEVHRTYRRRTATPAASEPDA
jgi:hypothetical protein